MAFSRFFVEVFRDRGLKQADDRLSRFERDTCVKRLYHHRLE